MRNKTNTKKLDNYIWKSDNSSILLPIFNNNEKLISNELDN